MKTSAARIQNVQFAVKSRCARVWKSSVELIFYCWSPTKLYKIRACSLKTFKFERKEDSKTRDSTDWFVERQEVSIKRRLFDWDQFIDWWSLLTGLRECLWWSQPTWSWDKSFVLKEDERLPQWTPAIWWKLHSSWPLQVSRWRIADLENGACYMSVA